MLLDNFVGDGYNVAGYIDDVAGYIDDVDG